MTGAERIPPVASIRTACEIYTERNKLGTADICELFGCGRTQAARLKKIVERERIARELPLAHPAYVDTDLAFEVWGLDYDKLLKKFMDRRRMEK